MPTKIRIRTIRKQGEVTGYQAILKRGVNVIKRGEVRQFEDTARAEARILKLKEELNLD